MATFMIILMNKPKEQVSRLTNLKFHTNETKNAAKVHKNRQTADAK
jgi:hypothetical protein